MPKIHSTAIVDSKAELANDVVVGPWAWIGPAVQIGPGSVIGPRALIEGNTVLGSGCKVANGAVIGTEPQDLKFAGESSGVRIGDQCTIREFVTINRATGTGENTVIGNRVFIMAYAHIAHNCLLEDEVIMANVATLAGHIQIQAGAIIGGLVAIHQFVRIGRYAIIGGSAGVRQDVIPFSMAAGYPCKTQGLNMLGLKRRGFSESRISAVRKAYKIIFRSGLKVEEAVESLKKEFPSHEDIQCLIDFIENSERGLAR